MLNLLHLSFTTSILDIFSVDIFSVDEVLQILGSPEQLAPS